jgi:hypothetical protein
MDPTTTVYRFDLVHEIAELRLRSQAGTVLVSAAALRSIGLDATREHNRDCSGCRLGSPLCFSNTPLGNPWVRVGSVRFHSPPR